MNNSINELHKSNLDRLYQRYLAAHRVFKSMQLRYLYESLKGSQVFSPLCAQLEEDAVRQFDQ